MSDRMHAPERVPRCVSPAERGPRARWWMGPGDEDDDDEVPIGDPDDDEGLDEDDEDDDEEPMQL